MIHRWKRKPSATRSRWAGKDVTRLIPVPGVESRPDPAHEGCDELLMPKFRSGLAARWIQPRLRRERAYVRVKLDATGTFVWRCMDGSRSVGEIIARVRETFPGEDEIPGRVWRFLTMMEMHGLIALEGDPKPVDSSADREHAA